MEQNSIDIDQLNADTPSEITWVRDLQDTNYIRLKFELDDDVMQYTLSSALQSLQKEMYSKLEFRLTGLEYNIEDNSGLVIFSPLLNIEICQSAHYTLSRTDSPTVTLCRTFAVDNIVKCSGEFIAMFEWGYTTTSITFKQNSGLCIHAELSNKNIEQQFTQIHQ